MYPADHIRITRKAVKLFHQYRPSNTSSEMLAHIDDMCEGSKEADDISRDRALNWHFYNRWLSLPISKPGFLSFLHLSPEHLLNRRDKELTAALEAGETRELYHYVGRILHHIQDMSTPTHVVPVYHGPIFKDSYETFYTLCYLNNPAHLNVIADDITDQTMSELEQIKINHVLEIYQRAACKTIEYLDPAHSSFCAMVDETPQQLSWSLFWQQDEKDFAPTPGRRFSFSNFGCFGPLGKKFGCTDPITVDGTTYRIELDEYHQICNHFTFQALKDSLLALLFLGKRIASAKPFSKLSQP